MREEQTGAGTAAVAFWVSSVYNLSSSTFISRPTGQVHVINPMTAYPEVKATATPLLFGKELNGPQNETFIALLRLCFVTLE